MGGIPRHYRQWTGNPETRKWQSHILKALPLGDLKDTCTVIVLYLLKHYINIELDWL